ncbi:MAG TPA: enolase C-terminal domain-like protein [Chloroflexota bacterium]|nr:enolase C-terminal domain-like protein [Chloroflexota bacterium]
MRIVDMQLTPVAVHDPPLRNSWGVHEPVFLRVIVRLRTDDGLIGLGEAPGGGAMLQALEAARSHVIGTDPWQLEPLRVSLRNARLFSALEEPCLDLIGKATGRPVADLLGGTIRRRVPYAAYLFFKEAGEDEWGEVMSPKAMVQLAERWVERWGFRCLKVKGGVLEPDAEVETMRLLRERFGPQMGLRIDPNAVWSVETSRRAAHKLRDVDLEYLEDPCAGITGMAEVAKATHIPLSTNMCVTAFEHLPEAFRAGAVSVVLADHHVWEGLTGCVKLGKICHSLGWGLGQHSNSHLGITMAAMTHLAAAVPNLIYASDSHYPWLEEDVIKGPMFRFVDGCLDVPSGPGLGVELDEAKLAVFAEAYERNRSHGRDDVSAMRKRDSSWLPLKPRW